MNTVSISVVRRLPIVLGWCLVATFASIVSGQSDPHVGTWKMNLAKSTFSPGPPPKSAARTYAPYGDGLKFTSETVDAASGQPVNTPRTSTGRTTR